MADSSDDWLLAVDFGTSYTAAAHLDRATGAVAPLALSHNGYLMPSSVFVGTPEHIEVGYVATHRAATDPGLFLASPKRLLSAGATVFDVGSWQVPASAVVGAVLGAVLHRAQGRHGNRPPAGLVLTYPEQWAPQQVSVLTDAAAGLGYPRELVAIVSEPIAAAHHYACRLAIAPEERFAVFDFGGGTLDVAVVAAGQDHDFGVLAAGGDNALGGRNLDAAIRRWVDAQLADDRPRLAAALSTATARDLRELDDSIREAKELLSSAPSAGIDVYAGTLHHTLHLTRSEFETVIAPEIDRAVAVTTRTLGAAGVRRPGLLRAICPTGGSSQIPYVHRQLQALGPLVTLDDPKTVVAQGALKALTRDEAIGGSTPAVAAAEPGPAIPPNGHRRPTTVRRLRFSPHRRAVRYSGAALAATAAVATAAVATAVGVWPGLPGGTADTTAKVVTVPTGRQPEDLAIDFATRTAYVTNSADDTVSVLDIGSHTVVATVAVGKNPRGVAIDPGAHTAYTANCAANSVSVIDLTTNAVTATVPVGKRPNGIAVDPDTHSVYVTNSVDDTVSVIDTGTNTVTKTIPVGQQPWSVAIGAHFAYVTDNLDDTVSVINTGTNTVTKTIPVGHQPEGIAVDPAGHSAYTANYKDNSVSVIDTGTGALRATIPVGHNPWDVAVQPAGHAAYATDSDDNTVSVVNTTTDTVTTTIPVGQDPWAVVVDSAGRTVYTTNWADNTVSVISNLGPPHTGES